MALRDTEAFLRQRAVLFDPNLDITPGSSFDVQLIQPMLRRLGSDPFTVDLTTFIHDRLVQAYPDLATKEGDSLTDLLNKPASLLFDVLVRENQRVARNLSFKDPATLTTDEADALGANYFSNRRTGDFSRGATRLFFTQAQDVSVNPVNFVTSKTGLRFYPTTVQSIQAGEMLLNVDATGLYYFDINLIAEAAGTEYNIGPNEMVSIANIPAATRVQNLRRFGFGEDEETAEEFVGRIEQELSERSLVTLRGIAAKILESFPEVNRLNVVGFNDPEMERDVLTGGGLGGIVAAGVAGSSIADTEGAARTRRFYTAEENFLTTVLGDASSWVLTVFQPLGSSSTVMAQDFQVRGVVNTNEIDLEEQGLAYGETGLRWSLRKSELTLSGIPGGILFPDTPAGTVSIPDDEVHVGGLYDVHTRGTDFDEGTLVLNNVTDDEPLFSGLELTVDAGSPNTVTLGDYVLDTDYDEDDSTYSTFADAEVRTYALQILEGPDAGNYRILSVTQVSGSGVELELDPEPGSPGATTYRWRLFDVINIDLVDPKETRVSGEDLRTLQGSDIVDTVGGINFDTYGVSEGDVLRIIGGADAGDYTLVADPIAPSFDQLQLDTVIGHTASNLDYVIFRLNEGGGVLRPLIRLTAVEILDSSGQPLGTTVPYAKPVDAQSRAFQNPTRGIKHDLRDAWLGLVSGEGDFTITSGWTVEYTMLNASGVPTVYPVTFTGGPTWTRDQVIAQINTDLASIHPQAAVAVGEDRFGIRPRKGGVRVTGGAARTPLYGSTDEYSTFDLRSQTVADDGGWALLDPEIDFDSGLDVVQVIDGDNIGYYEAEYEIVGTPPDTALRVDHQPVGPDFEGSGFSPETGRRVQIGARSLGSARVYFLAPTSFEVDPDSRFLLEQDEGDLYFLPDPTLTYPVIPAQPTGAQPQDGSIAGGGSQMTSTSQDFIRTNVQVDDQLVVTTHPIEGTQPLGSPVAGIAGTLVKTLVFSLDGGPDLTVIFIRDDASLNEDEVSRDGVIEQINNAAGEEICELTSSDTIKFTTTRELIVRSSGTANAILLDEVATTAPAESFVTTDQNNLSPHAGTYTVATVGQTTLDITGAFPASGVWPATLTEQTFQVLRQGVQRISTTAMSANEAEAGLYYFDVELVSEGTGDTWNIDADLQLIPSGYRSDGYYLTTGNDNLTFSPTEELGLVLSRTVLENGVEDDQANATSLSGQNIQLTYERADLVADIQNFISAETERVVCSNPLSRHLIPHFVRFDMTYAGGSPESVTVPEIEDYIRKLFPFDALESSDVQKIVLDRGANSITNPLDLIAIVHYTDRSVFATRSQNSLTTGRLAAFIPDVLDITRSLQ
jgi:hypothetical protein